MNPFIKSLASAAALALVMGLSSSSALALPSVTGAFIPGFQQWSDNSGELAMDAAGNPVSTLVQGDVLLGMVQISSFPSSGVNASTVNQLTAIFAIQVQSPPSPVAPAACGAGGVIASCSSFVFGSSGQSLAHWLTIASAPGKPLFGFTVPAGLTAANSIGAFYEGNGNSGAFRDFNTMVGDMTIASSGTLRMIIGDTSGTDNWSALGPTNLADFLLVPEGQGVGSFSLAQDIMFQNFLPFIFTSPVTGQGTISRDHLDPFGVTDNTSIFVNARVPEPATLTLLGFGLLVASLAAARRRQTK